MDVEKLIQAAESCKYRRNCDGCPGKIGNKGCLLNGSMEKALLAAKTHYEALIKAERSKVVQDVITEIESLDDPCRDIWDEEYSGALKEVIRVLEKLDSMEATNGKTSD